MQTVSVTESTSVETRHQRLHVLVTALHCQPLYLSRSVVLRARWRYTTCKPWHAHNRTIPQSNNPTRLLNVRTTELYPELPTAVHPLPTHFLPTSLVSTCVNLTFAVCTCNTHLCGQRYLMLRTAPFPFALKGMSGDMSFHLLFLKLPTSVPSSSNCSHVAPPCHLGK